MPPPGGTSTTPPPIEAVARAVQDRTQLELLAALTEADSLATGPAAWGQWKAGLVADLVRRVATYLDSGEVSRSVTADHRPPSRLHEPGPTPRSLGRCRRSAQRHGGGARPARAPVRRSPACSPCGASTFAPPTSPGEDGFAVETFVVEPSRNRWPDFKLVADQLEAVLRGTFPLEERLAEQVRAYAEGRRSVSSRPVEVRVDVDNEASSGSTVVDVRAEDDVGLLHRITTALFALDLDVVAARVATLGHEVLDAFYVRDAATGGKVTDPEQIQRIKDRIHPRHQRFHNRHDAPRDDRKTLSIQRKMRTSGALDPTPPWVQLHRSRMPCRKPHTDAAGATPGIIG